MANIVMVAKDFELEVQDTSATPAYIKVPELTSLELVNGANDIDLSNFDDDGFKSSLVVSRTRSINFACNYVVDETTKVLDPALKRINDLNDATGYQSIGNFRLTMPNGDKVTFQGTVKLGNFGGGVDDKLTFGGEIAINGKPVAEA